MTLRDAVRVERLTRDEIEERDGFTRDFAAALAFVAGIAVWLWLGHVIGL